VSLKNRAFCLTKGGFAPTTSSPSSHLAFSLIQKTVITSIPSEKATSAFREILTIPKTSYRYKYLTVFFIIFPALFNFLNVLVFKKISKLSKERIGESLLQMWN
jgi:hypothetical protein